MKAYRQRRPNNPTRHCRAGGPGLVFEKTLLSRGKSSLGWTVGQENEPMTSRGAANKIKYTSRVRSDGLYFTFLSLRDHAWYMGTEARIHLHAHQAISLEKKNKKKNTLRAYATHVLALAPAQDIFAGTGLHSQTAPSLI